MRIAGGQNIFVPILQVYNDVTERKKDIMKYRKALTFSYDDGIEQDRKLVEIFNRYGMKATFNLNTGIQSP